MNINDLIAAVEKHSKKVIGTDRHVSAAICPGQPSIVVATLAQDVRVNSDKVTVSTDFAISYFDVCDVSESVLIRKIQLAACGAKILLEHIGFVGRQK